MRLSGHPASAEAGGGGTLGLILLVVVMFREFQVNHAAALGTGPDGPPAARWLLRANPTLPGAAVDGPTANTGGVKREDRGALVLLVHGQDDGECPGQKACRHRWPHPERQGETGQNAVGLKGHVGGDARAASQHGPGRAMSLVALDQGRHDHAGATARTCLTASRTRGGLAPPRQSRRPRPDGRPGMITRPLGVSTMRGSTTRVGSNPDIGLLQLQLLTRAEAKAFPVGLGHHHRTGPAYRRPRARNIPGAYHGRDVYLGPWMAAMCPRRFSRGIHRARAWHQDERACKPGWAGSAGQPDDGGGPGDPAGLGARRPAPGSPCAGPGPQASTTARA